MTSQFLFEDQLSEALRMDSSLHISSRGSPTGPAAAAAAATGHRRMSRLKSDSNPILAGSNSSVGGGLNRSRSAAGVLSPSSFLNRGRSPSAGRLNGAAGRSKTPTRCGLPEVSSSSRRGSMTPTRALGQDRFIPNRSTTDFESANHSLVNAAGGGNGSDEAAAADGANISIADQQRRQTMKEILNPNQSSDSRILSFKSKAPSAREDHLNNHKVLFSSGKPKAPKAANTRQVPTKPEKILDAPDLMNDFYLHLLDWSKLNHLAVALCGSLFVWNAGDGSIVELFQFETDDELVTSVRWVSEGNILAVGDSTGGVALWDAAASKRVRLMSGHTDRVATLDWNAHILASGGRSGAVHLHDVRVADHHTATLEGHSQEVCGLAWSGTGSLLATGGNDNLVQLWSPSAPSAPALTLTQHQSAVKAVSWCPWQHNVLATGGGTVDRTIRFWNATNGNCINSVDSGSQVSSLVWNTEYQELMSGHGFSHNQLTLWRYPSMTKVADLKGHTSRVLQLLVSPDGTTVASAAADETIRLWKVWPKSEKKGGKEAAAKSKAHPVSKLTQRIR